MPIPRQETQDVRVIAHVDMDCFYVQVEQRKRPELRGVPTAVVQYNSWKGGGLIAVGYEARKFGVKRSMRGDEAKRACPNIHLIQVPVARGKADLNSYRAAGSEVVSILATKGRCERASIDEVYLDLTDAAESMLSENPPKELKEIDEEALKSHILGLSEGDRTREHCVKEWAVRSDADYRDKLLACGAIIVAQLRMQVYAETTFTCSAGVAHNKMLAKVASAMNKPAQQTIVPSSSVKDLLSCLPIKKIKHLGGKLGSSLQSDLGINNVGDLLLFSEEKLQERYGRNTGMWLWNIGRGMDGEEVHGRLLPKSLGCGKTFPGPQALRTLSSVQHWLNELCEELSERIQTDLKKNMRTAQTLSLHAAVFKTDDLNTLKKFPSKSCPLRYGAAKIKEDAMRLFDSALREYLGMQNVGWVVTALSVTASKILETPQGNPSSVLNQASDGAKLDDLQFANADSDDYTEPHNTKHMGWARTGGLVNIVDTSISNQTIQSKQKSMTKQNGKGKCSILKFLQGNNSCQSVFEQGHCELIQDDMAELSSQGSKCGLELNKTANSKSQQRRGKYDVSDNDQRNNNMESWEYSIEEIDPSIVDELPPEIKRELQQWLRPLKHAKTTRRGSNISDYFLPAKKP